MKLSFTKYVIKLRIFENILNIINWDNITTKSVFSVHILHLLWKIGGTIQCIKINYKIKNIYTF